MPDDRKHPSAGFWLTVALVAVLVGYPLSFGPVWWLVDWEVLPVQGAEVVYGPIARTLAIIGSDSICAVMDAYCKWGGDHSRVPLPTLVERE